MPAEARDELGEIEFDREHRGEHGKLDQKIPFHVGTGAELDGEEEVKHDAGEEQCVHENLSRGMQRLWPPL